MLCVKLAVLIIFILMFVLRGSFTHEETVYVESLFPLLHLHPKPLGSDTADGQSEKGVSSLVVDSRAAVLLGSVVRRAALFSEYNKQGMRTIYMEVSSS